MQIPITKSKWTAENLPEGLSITNGIISGTPTTTGSYTAYVNVETNWGTDRKAISINVASAGTKYPVYKDGVLLENISLSQLVSSIRDGTAQEKYNTTSTYIVIPVKHPHEDYFETMKNDFPMNFCSFQNVTLQDGTTKPGLILQFGRSLWNGTQENNYDEQFVVRFDECEPDDTDFPDLEEQGLNIYSLSNIRQWLNGAGDYTSWYTKSHEFDELDYAYFQLKGLLSCLPEDLVELLTPIKIQTQRPNDFGGTVDTSYDKIFLPSLEEMYATFLESPNEIPKSGVEGNAWNFWRNLFDTENPFSDKDTRTIYTQTENSYTLDHSKWIYPIDIKDTIPASDLNNWNYQGFGLLTRSANMKYITQVWQVKGNTGPTYSMTDEADAFVAPAFALC